MAWSKLKDKEPANKDDEYFLRNIGDKYTGWWDDEEKSFYMIGRDSGIDYFTKEEYPNIEWWDEEESNQDELWEEVLGQLHPYFIKQDYAEFKERFLQSYSLIRK